MSIFIIRAFVKLRQSIAEHKELSHRLNQLEQQLADHDKQILSLVQAIRQLTSPVPVPKKRCIGFYKKEP